MEIDNNDDLALSILKEKCFDSQHKSIEELANGLSDFLIKNIENRNRISPRAKSLYFVFMYKIDLLKVKLKRKIFFLTQKIYQKSIF